MCDGVTQGTAGMELSLFEVMGLHVPGAVFETPGTEIREQLTSAAAQLGCFVSGDFDTHDQQLRKLANSSGAIVVAVKYRLAPEHVYPAAHDDCFRAVEVVHKHCAEWGGNRDNIVLAGDSYVKNGDHYMVTRDTLVTGYEMYMKDLPAADAEASPLNRDDLAGLPETHILTAEFDPLVDEGEQLYRNLV